MPQLAWLSVRDLLRQGHAQLNEKAVSSASLAAELLLMHVLDQDRTWLYTHPEDAVELELAAQYFELIGRRAVGWPIQYLTGRQEFWSLEFEVTPAVLIPRPETEHVVEVALQHLGSARRGEPLRLADVGTGSGCIAVALAKELPAAEIFATDISDAALGVARRNAARLGVSHRIQFLQCNLLEGLPQGSQGSEHGSPPLDMIVSNPPYVPRRDFAQLPRDVREHEPEVALLAGEDGLAIYKPLIPQAAERLLPGGIFVLELGSGASDCVRPLVETPAWTNISITNDLAGFPRVLGAKKS